MKWYNLKNNKCPQCNHDFTVGLKVEEGTEVTSSDRMLYRRITPLPNNEKMFVHKCGFKISERRYKEIVSGMVIKDLKWK